ncbi:MAG TPA: NAD-dependent epimerase/dehydratase family protein [Candidatus Sumerlaeota bacterium]|nr:NAD-dependent epimerase/dehydratase family protein [Candidatus Sumerlaeota bacterium]HOR26989.1 NAD-dependent epimerase/dehydratase family protein [Candidatus Sumerlaeota bacterium]HPK02139.1 NAD-dependent epimerase/dehydratase family protein [Candidatus Sumerlaeota bacterium]
MKILVTGAAGFIGSHLAERLAAAGHEVVGIDCFTEYYSTALKRLNAEDVRSHGVTIHELDLAADDLSRAVRGVEAVIHLAAQPGISDHVSFQTYVRNNMEATWRLLEAVKSQDSLRGFINVATSSVYGAHATDDEETAPKPTSYYGVTKLAAEQLVLAYHRDKALPACSLRIFSVYGERERPEKLYPKLISSILEGREFPLHRGSDRHSRTFTYISDVLDAFEAVLARLDACNGEILNIGSDIEITTGEGIALIEKIMGRRARLAIKPPRAGDQLKTRANIEKARRLLGWEPRVPPEEGLRREVEWYENRIYGRVAI